MNIPADEIRKNVTTALAEDIGEGDVTAALVPATINVSATLIVREDATLCGRAWFDEVFHQLDPAISTAWDCQDGDLISPNQVLCRIQGPIRPVLSGERTALNFLQTLSGTATTVAAFADLIKDTDARLLDTRKTLPGLRQAQKYAVSCGGGTNHRSGLYDGILIKENHIPGAGGIDTILKQAKQCGLPVEIEVESVEELQQALTGEPDQILLDNFTIAELNEAVAITAGRAKLEASGNIDQHTIRAVADTGVDYISIGALTKHVRAIDFSLRLDEITESNT